MKKLPMIKIIPFILFFTIFLADPAQAGCRNNKPICGNSNICHSNRRAKNVNDLRQPIHPNLCKALNNMENKFGRLEILSAYRGATNARRAGAKNSMHKQVGGGPSLAVDVYRPANRQSMYQFLGNQKCQDRKLRYNIYCGTGTVHMDMNILGRRENSNYSRCRNFFRVKCDGSNSHDDTEYRSEVVEAYKSRPRRNLRKCYQAKRWGSCCGPKRRAAGRCR